MCVILTALLCVVLFSLPTVTEAVMKTGSQRPGRFPYLLRWWRRCRKSRQQPEKRNSSPLCQVRGHYTWTHCDRTYIILSLGLGSSGDEQREFVSCDSVFTPAPSRWASLWPPRARHSPVVTFLCECVLACEIFAVLWSPQSPSLCTLNPASLMWTCLSVRQMPQYPTSRTMTASYGAPHWLSSNSVFFRDIENEMSQMTLCLCVHPQAEHEAGEV